MLKSGARKRGRALERMVLCVVLAVGPLPPMSTSRPPDVIHVMNAPTPSPFYFLSIFRFRVLLIVNANGRSKRGELGARLAVPLLKIKVASEILPVCVWSTHY